MFPSEQNKFVILAVLDGWGISKSVEGNAITKANTPNMDRFWASFPHTQVEAAGEPVGLPKGEAGNTETGHLNLGAGRIIYQDLQRINMSIADGNFFKNQILLSAIEHARSNNSKLHFMGLIGGGGVHSNMQHLYAFLHLANKKDFRNLYLHLFTDGRDSPPTSSLTYIKQVEEMARKEMAGKVVSIMGRYWAMDRDRRWDRTRKAYLALTKGEGNLVKTPQEAIEMSYQEGKTDEFIEPFVVSDNSGNPIGRIEANDAVIFFNFRIDRARQLSRAFVGKDFSKINNFQDRGPRLENNYFAMMTEYSKLLVKDGALVAFPREIIRNTLGEVLANEGLYQLRIAESEKERFVTYYFNGQNVKPFTGEDRIIIPSPKVPTYDLKPEMSAVEMTNSLISKIKGSDHYSFVLLNYANPDMLGHTGNIGPTVKGLEIVDDCIGQVANYVLASGGALFITADHGNCEEMINPRTGKIDTEHSLNPVPFVAVSKRFIDRPQMLPSGILADIAPTVLGFLEVMPPGEMTGRNLLKDVLEHV